MKYTVEYENGTIKEIKVSTGDRLILPPNTKIIETEEQGD